MIRTSRRGLAVLCAILGCRTVAFAATSPQSCDTAQYPLSSPTAQFEDHGDGTVTDRQSNLMWLRCSLGQEWSGGACVGEARPVTWAEAQASAKEMNSLGKHFYNDWRVPQIQELASIAERQCSNPRINSEVFPRTLSADYWSSTSRPRADAGTAAFVLNFGAAGVAYENKESRRYARLVRNAP